MVAANQHVFAGSEFVVAHGLLLAPFILYYEGQAGLGRVRFGKTIADGRGTTRERVAKSFQRSAVSYQPVAR